VEPALTQRLSIHMAEPHIEGLLRVAAFEVDDLVYTRSGAKPWRITGRYWSPRQQSIVYDLLFEYNGVVLQRVPERDLSREEKSRYSKRF
jgi:hypothetical protein